MENLQVANIYILGIIRWKPWKSSEKNTLNIMIVYWLQKDMTVKMNEMQNISKFVSAVGVSIRPLSIFSLEAKVQ